MISWPPWVRVWGWASYRFLPFIVFSLACPFVSWVILFIYDVRVRGVVSVFNETSHSFVVWGSSWPSVALPCCYHCLVGCIMYMDYMYPAIVLLLASSFFSESVVVFSLFPFFFTMRSFLSLVYWPFRPCLLACLIRASILYFSCRLHLFTSRCFVISNPD